MIKLLLQFFILLFLSVPDMVFASESGIVELSYYDKDRDRPLDVRVWYPSVSSNKDHSISYDGAFKGNAIEGGEYLPSLKSRPLVVLSHGDKGSNVDQSWLAEALAGDGYIVVAVSHWQNTWKNNTPEATLKVWNRPKDISFIIDQMLKHDVWGSRIDEDNILAAGHSAGGYTVLALAGAIYSYPKMEGYCKSQVEIRECNLGEGADKSNIDFSKSIESHRDPRIKAVIAMTPALGPGVELESLKKINIPVLIISAKDDALLDLNLNALSYADGIPNSTLLALPKGGHFVFMPECTFMGKAFTFFHRFDICGRRAGLVEERPIIHSKIISAVQGFIHSNINN